MALRGISLFALAFGFAAAAHAQAPGGPPPAVDVANPLVQDVTESEEFIGRFDAVDQVDIRARVTGYVDKIAVKDGVLVKAGDVLFTIDKRPYQAALDQAKAAAASPLNR